jgi:hypothetical protein
MRIFLILGLAGTHVLAAPVTVDDYQSFCACIVLKSLINSTYGSEAELILQNVSLSLSTSDQQLYKNWSAYPDYPITIFADENGKPTHNLTDAVGLLARDIYAYCGPSKVRQVR